ncbi:MAG: hypothetical protein GY820_10385 [Gammaproteobacteria bacterium]|nr:hypothetical protein [Gammaproteobacteria bacterium]
MNLITVTPDYMLGYANLPRFNFTFSEDFPSHSYENGVYKHVGYDKLLVTTDLISGANSDVRTRYQMVCRDLADGNPNYSYGLYPAGWSSRAGVINKIFGKCLVEAGHMYGIHLSTAIDAIADQYDGVVLMWVEDDWSDLRFNLVPWDHTRVASSFVPAGCEHMFLSTRETLFTSIADQFFSKYHESL